MGKTTKIRLTEEEARAEEEANNPTPRKLTKKQQDQLAFRTGNRRTRRAIAKRNGFYKDHTGEAWRKSNEMIRTPNNGDMLL